MFFVVSLLSVVLLIVGLALLFNANLAMSSGVVLAILFIVLSIALSTIVGFFELNRKMDKLLKHQNIDK